MASGILGAVGHRGVGTLTAVVWYGITSGGGIHVDASLQH